MTKFSTFDRKTLKNLRTEMQDLLASYGVKSNLDIKVGNMSFSDAEVTIKVAAKIVGAKTMKDTMLEVMVADYSLKMKNSDGDELVEYNSRASKMPWVLAFTEK